MSREIDCPVTRPSNRAQQMLRRCFSQRKGNIPALTILHKRELPLACLNLPYRAITFLHMLWGGCILVIWIVSIAPDATLSCMLGSSSIRTPSPQPSSSESSASRFAGIKFAEFKVFSLSSQSFPGVEGGSTRHCFTGGMPVLRRERVA